MDNKRLQFTVTQECLDNIPTENGDIGLKKYCDKKQRNTLCCILKNTQGESELFNLIPIGYLLIEGLTQRITEIWEDVLVYSFFTGPCLIIIIFVIFLVMLLYDYAYGHSVK